LFFVLCRGQKCPKNGALLGIKEKNLGDKKKKVGDKKKKVGDRKKKVGDKKKKVFYFFFWYNKRKKGLVWNF